MEQLQFLSRITEQIGMEVVQEHCTGLEQSLLALQLDTLEFLMPN
jgi:hypothetical protein